MASLIEELMKEDWVMAHVRPCAENNLTKSTVQETILPVVTRLVDDREGERDFVKNLAREFEKNSLPADVQEALSCIEAKIGYKLEERDLGNVEGFVGQMSCSLLGKFFYLHCRKFGLPVS